jgi:hypothetical protein
MGLPDLDLSPDWCVNLYVLPYHISHQVPGPTEIESHIPIEVPGKSLTSIASFIKWSMYPLALSSMEVLPKLILRRFKSMLCNS